MSYAAKEHPMLGLHVFLKIPVVGAGGRFLPFLVCPCCLFGMFLLKLLLGNNADSPRAGCCGSQGFQPCPSAPLGLFAFPSPPASTAHVFNTSFSWCRSLIFTFFGNPSALGASLTAPRRQS